MSIHAASDVSRVTLAPCNPGAWIASSHVFGSDSNGRRTYCCRHEIGSGKRSRPSHFFAGDGWMDVSHVLRTCKEFSQVHVAAFRRGKATGIEVGATDV